MQLLLYIVPKNSPLFTMQFSKDYEGELTDDRLHMWPVTWQRMWAAVVIVQFGNQV